MQRLIATPLIVCLLVYLFDNIEKIKFKILFTFDTNEILFYSVHVLLTSYVNYLSNSVNFLHP